MSLKNKLYKSVVLLILILSSTAAVCSSNFKNSKKVKDGWSEAYGGNAESAEFVFLAAEVLNSGVGEHEFEKNHIKKVIKNSKVICSKNLVLDGLQKDGINFPNKKPQVIYLDCDKWSMHMNIEQKLLMSVHEFLPLLGQTDADYAVASELVGHYKAKLRSRASY